MATAVDFHSQIASIMEVLANAAVAEICKVVDDGYAVVQLEMSRSQKENEFLRRKIKLLELQIARYRAERVRGPGNTQAGSVLQCRTRFLNLGPGTQQSLQRPQPMKLDQDPDQEVVTTTKSEPADLDNDEDLMIVKMEKPVEASDTNCKAPAEDSIMTRGGGDAVMSLPCGSKNASDAQPAGHRSETEVPGRRQKNTSSPQNKEKLEEAGGDLKAAEAPENLTSSSMLQEWQDSNEAEDMERPSCSTYIPEVIPGNSSSSSSPFSQIKANFTSSLVSVPKMSESSTDQESSTSDCDVIVINSLPQKMEDDCSDALSGKQGALGNSVTPLSDARPQYRMFDGNGAYSNRLSSFNNPPVAVGTVETQQAPPLWSGLEQMANASLLAHQPSSNQNLHSQPSTSQSQDSGPGQSPSQQLCLPYACMFCSRRYAHQCQLRIHERVHTGEKPYQCIQCGKSFGQFCSLKRHQMVHTGERPFPCPHCGKQFSTSTNLKVHQSVHTGEKKFHCSKCGKNFSFLSNLIRHQALHTAK